MEENNAMTVENELILKARNGDDAALTQLVKTYMDFAREKAKGYVSSDIEYDDLVQEAMIGFLSAYYTYKTDGSASFKTYAGVCMDHRIISAINTLNRKKRIPPSSLVPMDEMDAQTVDLSADPEAYFIMKEQTKRLMTRIDESLSDFEKQVFHLFLSGNSYENIAEQLQSGTKSIDNAIQRIRRKLKKTVDAM